MKAVVVIIGVVAAGAAVLGIRSASDVKRYLRMRKM